MTRRHTPCEFCGYPISETHHPYKVSLFGRNKFTIQLCANCHEFYHLVENFLGGSSTAENTINHMLGCDGPRFSRLMEMAIHYINQVKDGTR